MITNQYKTTIWDINESVGSKSKATITKYGDVFINVFTDQFSDVMTTNKPTLFISWQS